jgi:hypothetical protein
MNTIRLGIIMNGAFYESARPLHRWRDARR